MPERAQLDGTPGTTAVAAAFTVLQEGFPRKEGRGRGDGRLCIVFESMKQKMHARSAAILVTLESRLHRILIGWLLIAGLASALRLAVPPIGGPIDAQGLLPYVLLLIAPFASTLLALRWFADGDRHPQPSTRLAVIGRWKCVRMATARAHPLFGTSGIMVSLLVGMMLNVPFRALEYWAAMPVISAEVPLWLSTLHAAMSFDVVLFSSLYMIAFVAALRRVPLFPRLLAAIWVCDIATQLFIAELVAGTDGLPPTVANALHGMLEGNIKKVLISVALWLPYLLLSRRVNVTYRHRIPA